MISNLPIETSPPFSACIPLRAWFPGGGGSYILSLLILFGGGLTSEGLPADPPASSPPRVENLADGQDAIQLRYKKFTQILQEMTEYLRHTEPDRAALLTQVSRQGNEARVADQMDRLIQLLQKGQLGEAIEREEELLASLQAILDVMNSEDRAQELAEEKARIEAYLKDVNRLIGNQRDIRSGTERGSNSTELAPRQENLEQQTSKLREKMQQDQQKSKPKSKSSEGKQSESGKPESPSRDQQSPKSPSEKPEKSGQPENSETPPQNSGDQPPSEKSSSDQTAPAQQGESESAQSDKPDDESRPGSEELKKAQQQMRQALEQLQKKQNRQASEKQDQALLELEKAKQKLEEILRQLREEERERMLVGLEERLQRLLASQTLILTETISIAEIPDAQRNSRHRNKSVQLSRQQKELQLDTEKLLRLLREEGSAIAFPEVVTQMREDMQIVIDRLAQMEVGNLTQSIESDIIDAIKEMILSLQRELEENRQKKMKSSQPSGKPEDPDLVNQIAELKMLRSLQLRVNRRTQQLGKLVEGDQAADPQLVDQLRNLSQSQSRIQRATYDLATQKNQQ